MGLSVSSLVVQGYVLGQVGNFNIYMGGARQPEEHGTYFVVGGDTFSTRSRSYDRRGDYCMMRLWSAEDSAGSSGVWEDQVSLLDIYINPFPFKFYMMSVGQSRRQYLIYDYSSNLVR